MESILLGYFLVLTRSATFVGFFPLFGGRSIPRMVKIGVAGALSVVWWELYGVQATLAASSFDGSMLLIGGAVVRELLLGAALGYCCGLLLFPARMAGAYIGQEMGLTMATVADPGSADPSNVVSQVFESLATLAFLGLDAHHGMLLTLHQSFDALPIGAAPWRFPALAMAHQTALAHHSALLIAAPVAACMLLVSIVLGLLMKAAPAFNVFSVGLAVRVAAGLAATLVFLPPMFGVLQRITLNSASWMNWLLDAG